MGDGPKKVDGADWIGMSEEERRKMRKGLPADCAGSYADATACQRCARCMETMRKFLAARDFTLNVMPHFIPALTFAGLMANQLAENEPSDLSERYRDRGRDFANIASELLTGLKGVFGDDFDEREIDLGPFGA